MAQEPRKHKRKKILVLILQSLVEGSMTGYLLFLCMLIAWAAKMGASKTMNRPKYLHQAPEAHKTYPGWQTPGFCRPTWILDRTFRDTNRKTPAMDRLYIKLQMDSSMRVVEVKRRLFDWRSSAQVKAAGKPAAISAESESNSATNRKKISQVNANSDGSWRFKDGYLQTPGKFTLDMTDNENSSLLRYECNFEFGSMDGYAVKFREGKIYRFRGIQKANSLPINPEEIGSFVIRANTNRPFAGKEFQAFQS